MLSGKMIRLVNNLADVNSIFEQVRPGETLLVSRKATGTLVADNLLPARRLLLLSTGTGLAPFASVIKDPDIYERFEKVILVHGCRKVAELAYGERLIERMKSNELFAEMIADRLFYYPTVTREPFQNRGRITDLIESGRLFQCIDGTGLDISTDRVMICGSPAMLTDFRSFFESRQFLEGSHGGAGHFVIERAFVER